jgi:hypothetical protein
MLLRATGDGLIAKDELEPSLVTLGPAAVPDEPVLARLGFALSDPAGPMLSWWRCDDDHHGVVLSRHPVTRLHHYVWAFADFASLGGMADRAAFLLADRPVARTAAGR